MKRPIWILALALLPIVSVAQAAKVTMPSFDGLAAKAKETVNITLDRDRGGSDQAASVEPGGFERLVKYIRVSEAAVGDGVKRVYDSEQSSLKRLRRVED